MRNIHRTCIVLSEINNNITLAETSNKFFAVFLKALASFPLGHLDSCFSILDYNSHQQQKILHWIKLHRRLVCKILQIKAVVFYQVPVKLELETLRKNHPDKFLSFINLTNKCKLTCKLLVLLRKGVSLKTWWAPTSVTQRQSSSSIVNPCGR